MSGYCIECALSFDGESCPACGKVPAREARPDDLCFLTEREAVWSDMLADVLEQRKIPFLQKRMLGAGVALETGPLRERVRFYVRYGQLAEAAEAVEELFSVPDEGIPEENPAIRKATVDDLSRIAEILVFVKRIKFRPIFQDDAYSFGELQVLRVARQYADPAVLDRILVYDDGIVKGLIRIEGKEIVELYVDWFFQNRGIGAALIEYAKERYPVDHLWAIEKNTDAIRFYEDHGFHLTDIKKYEEGTTEYLVRMETGPSNGREEDRNEKSPD